MLGFVFTIELPFILYILVSFYSNVEKIPPYLVRYFFLLLFIDKTSYLIYK